LASALAIPTLAHVQPRHFVSRNFAAEVQEEVVKHFEGGAQEELRTLEETAGIPTGLAPDIHKQIELRRAKQRKPAPDNLAPETTV